MKGGILNRDETSYRKKMESSFQADEIIKAVSDYYGMIGRIFDNLSYSAVANAHQRMSSAVNKKRAIRKKVEDIIVNMS